MRKTQEVCVTIETRNCPTCGVTYGTPNGFITERRESNETFYCPNGHGRHFPPGGSEAEKLQAELERTKKDLTRSIQARQYAERCCAAEKGAKTRLKNRIKNGVCPCCNRSFKNVERHMANKHPDFIDNEE